MVIFTVVLFFCHKVYFPKASRNMGYDLPICNNFPLPVSLGVSLGYHRCCTDISDHLLGHLLEWRDGFFYTIQRVKKYNAHIRLGFKNYFENRAKFNFLCLGGTTPPIDM